MRSLGKLTARVHPVLGAALVLPSISLAAFYAVVGHLADQRPAELVNAAWSMLMLLPGPRFLLVCLALACAAVAAAIVGILRFHWLLPLLVFVAGVTSSGYTVWVMGLSRTGLNWPLLLGLAGTGLSGLSLWTYRPWPTPSRA